MPTSTDQRPQKPTTTPNAPCSGLFCDAWKAAITPYPGLFNCDGHRELERATHWHQMAPNLARIRKTIPDRQQSDAAFIALLASLYNPEEGQKLLNKAGVRLGDLPTILQPKQRHLLCVLLSNFTQW